MTLVRDQKSEINVPAAAGWHHPQARPRNSFDAEGKPRAHAARTASTDALGERNDKVLFDQEAFCTESGCVSRSRHKINEIIFARGAADSIVFVQQGKVRVTRTSEGGRESVAAMLGVAPSIEARRTKYDQRFDGPTPITKVSMDLEIDVDRVGLNFRKGDVLAAYRTRVA
jgi:CRP-like cAMP-binding protein